MRDDDEIRDLGPEEEQLEQIHAEALRLARAVDPDIPFVVDRRPIDAYCIRVRDYPGGWYSKGFRLPDGFHSRAELVEAIAKDTVAYFSQKRKAAGRAEQPKRNHALAFRIAVRRTLMKLRKKRRAKQK